MSNSCLKCNGRGGYGRWVSYPYPHNEFDECEICEGTGKVKKRPTNHNPAEVDFVALALATGFYAKGTIYDASVDNVIKIRWREWREQAIDAIDAIDEFRNSK